MNNTKLTNNKIVKIIETVISIVKVIIFVVATIGILIYSYKSINQKRYNVSKEVIFQLSNDNEEDDGNYSKEGKDYNIQESKKNLNDNEMPDANATSESEHMQDNNIDETEYQEEVLDESKISDEPQNETPNEENQITSPNDSQPTTEPTQDSTSVPVINSTNVIEGQNPTEGLALMTYINQYRTELGISPLVWNDNLEYEAQYDAMHKATGEGTPRFGYFHTIARRCNGAKTAQEAVSDWMTGNDYIPSEADFLLNEGYTEVGGALYYLPNGDENGYHYFWVLCLM